MKSKPTPICRICGTRPADSDEHFIPKATGNRSVVRLLVQETDGTQRERHLKGGFFLPVLCKQCNSSPASTYAQAYVDLFRKLERAPDLITGDGNLAFHAHSIFPLRFIKQAILAFLCAAPWYPAPEWKPLQEFLQDREALLPESAPRVYLYINTSKLGRVVPLCGITELAHNCTTMVSEISWPPLGIVMSYERHPILTSMVDITDWGQSDFSVRTSKVLQLPRLRVNSIYPLAFGSAKEVKRRERENLPAYLFHVPDASSSPTKLCVLLRRG